MVTTNIKEYSDDDLILLINGAKKGDVPYTMNDLKKLLSEVTNRRLDQRYTNILTYLMQGEITGENPAPVREDDTFVSAPKRPVTQKQESYNEPVFDDSFEYDKYPILNFLAGLFKVLAWLFLIGSISASAVVSFVNFKGQVLFMAAAIFGGIMVGTILLLIFYAQSEKISLQLEIEHHLRRK